MTLPEGPKSVYSLDLEDLLSQAHRSRDLLIGAKALLVGVRDSRAAIACHSVMEARAQLDGIVHAIEGLAAVEHEMKRSEQRTEAAKRAAGGTL